MNSIGSNQVEFEPTNKTKEKDNMKTISKAVAVASLISAGFIGTQAHAAEVSASAAVSSMYLWRGQNLSNGAAAVSGDLSVSMGGAYAGIWTSSGDAGFGSEYDLYVGYGLEVADVALDLSYASYIYPNDATGDNGGADDLTDSQDVIFKASTAGVEFGAYVNVTEDSDVVYYTLGYGMDKISAMVGVTTGSTTEVGTDPEADNNYTHLDVTYAYNDNLSFTVSQIVAQDLETDPKEDAAEADKALDDSTLFVATYSLPIE